MEHEKHKGKMPPKGMHKMPNGKTMKDSEMKKAHKKMSKQKGFMDY